MRFSPALLLNLRLTGTVVLFRSLLLCPVFLLCALSVSVAAQSAPGAPFAASAGFSDQRPGSVLVWNIYTSDVASLNSQNTEISLTNTHLTAAVTVHFFYIAADGSSADQFVDLQANGTMSMLASDFDPDNTGYIVAVAVDPTTGSPISFNHLIGSAMVKFASGHRASLGAQTFQALFTGGLAGFVTGSGEATLRFDGDPNSGASYSRMPRTLSLTSIPSRLDGNDTMLIVNRIGGDLTAGAGSLGKLTGVLFDPQENGYGFQFSGASQYRSSLTSATIRTTPRFDSIIPPGNYGWMQFWTVNDVGILGAAINKSSSAFGFEKGWSLPALSFSPGVTLTISAYPAFGSGNPTTTTISSSLNPSSVGQAVTFTATVNGSGTPTGGMQFYDGATLLNTITLSGNQASFTTSALTAGDHVITAVYLGDGTFNVSASNGLIQTVNQTTKAATTTLLASSNNPASTGQTVTFTATVTGSGGTPTGTVEFFDDVTSLGVVTLNGGTAALSVSNLSAASHTITATYSGDTSFLSSSSTPLTQTIQAIQSLPIDATTEFSDQKLGSVLVYNFFSSSATDPNVENTSLSLTNTSVADAVTVHLFFADGSTGEVTDQFINLAANQIVTLLASNVLAGRSGYAVAVAVDSTTGAPISFNHLMGEAEVKLATGHFAALPAQAFAALYSGTLGSWSAGQTTAVLNFDGNTGYNRVPRTLALNQIPSRLEGNNTLLIVNRFGGSFVSSAASIGGMSGVVYDLITNGYGFTTSGGVQIKRTLGTNGFPHTAPSFNTILPPGSYGWMEMQGVNEIGLLGSYLNFNPNASSNAIAFNSGENLHAVTLTPNVTLTVPVYPPATGRYPSQTIFDVSPDIAESEQQVIFTVTVSAISPITSTPTGRVAFFDGATKIFEATLTNGTTTFALPLSLSVGMHNLSAQYLGDGVFQSSNSTTETLEINNAGKAATTTTILSSLNPAQETQPVTFTASVTSSNGTPTGTVEFFRQSTSLGTATMNNGVASLTVSSLTIGTHSISARYNGDSSFLRSQSAVLTQTVNPQPLPPVAPANAVPASSEFSDQKLGSVLVFNLYSSNSANLNAENSSLSLTNTHATTTAVVNLFFVRGNDGSVKSRFVILAPNQTVTLLASTEDADRSGLAIAIAIDPNTGAPISFNHLMGEVEIKLATGHFAALPAQAYAALYTGTLPGFTSGNTAATLNFDGVVYNKAARSLALDHLASPGEGNSTVLVINRFGGSLVTPAATTWSGFGRLYDAITSLHSFTYNAGGASQFRRILNNSFPSVPGGFNNVIFPGGYGWMDLYATSGSLATTGAVLNFNANTANNPTAFNYGYNLRAETLQSATLEMPVSSPNTPPNYFDLSAVTRTKGSAGIISRLVGVSDDFTAAGDLIVTANSVPAGITVSNIVNTNGSITALVAADCAATVGANNVELKVTDAGGLETIIPLTVQVNDNPLPTLGNYTNTAVTLNDATTITPDAAPSDNGTISSLTAAAPGFTGSFNANATTGVISVSNAAPAGTHIVTVTATDNCGGSTQKTFELQVNKLPTTTAISSSLNASGYGQAVTFTATVTSSSNPVTTGTVTFTDGAAVLASAVALNANGQASVTTSLLTATTHTITATYDGSAQLASSSNSLAQTVNKAALNITVANQTKVFGATLPAFTGTITGVQNGDNISATYSTTATSNSPVGMYPITPVLNDPGNRLSNYNVAATNGTLTITKATTTTMLSASANPSITGQSVTFTTAVAPGTATGTVEFFNGTTSLGTASVNAGTALVNVSSLTTGIYTINATYSGDGNHNASNAAAFTHTVSATANTPAGSNVPVSAGDTTLNFANVSQQGTTTITPVPPAGAGTLPSGYTITETNLAFDITTTATFSGSIVITFNLPSITDPVQFSRVRVLHQENGVYVDRTILPPDSPAPNFAAKTVSARVPSLSPFVIASLVQPGDLAPATATSDDKPGSVLVYNLYTSSVANPAAENTRLTLTNVDELRDAIVHLFFVDSATCSVADSFVCLTANQTVSLLASDIDPGVTGYVIAVAVNSTGCPTQRNTLIGSAWVKLQSGHKAQLNAEAFAALNATPATCSLAQSTATIKFDGVNYSAAPRVLSASSLMSAADGNSGLLILNRLGGSLNSSAASIGTLVGVLYDDQENPFSFQSSGNCQLRRTLTNDFPRTVPRYNQILSAGRTGWMKLRSADDVAIVGSIINYHPVALTNPNAYNHGRNLHKLTTTTTAELIVPVITPNCN